MPKVGDARPAGVAVPFRLLDLPPELWVKIGKLAVDDSKPISTMSFSKGHQPPKQPSITRTCSALRRELLPYYYTNHVGFALGGDKLRYIVKLQRWLQALDKQMRQFITGSITFRRRGEILKMQQKCRDLFGVESLRIAFVPEESARGAKYWVSFPAPAVHVLGDGSMRVTCYQKTHFARLK